MHRTLALVALLLAVAAGPALADEEETQGLSIGDPAPALDIAHWVKGVEMDRRGNFEPVTEFEDGKVYVIEFWASWCGPCRAGMPHISELQEQYADDVVVISVSNESLPKVYEFLWQKDRDGTVQNDRTRYMLTTDPDGSTHKDYMEAAGQSGIPSAFVVGKSGLVEWIGHPMKLGDVLEALVADTWDREAFKANLEAEKKLQKALRAAGPRLQAAAGAEEWEKVVEIIDEVLEVAPDHMQLRMEKLSVLLVKIDDKERAYAFAEEVAKGGWDNAQMLNAMAWLIADNEEVKHRDLDFALKAAERATELTESKDASILDTLARVHYEQGDLDAAIEWQTKAVDAAEGQLKANLQEALDKYRSEKEEQDEPMEDEPEEE